MYVTCKNITAEAQALMDDWNAKLEKVRELQHDMKVIQKQIEDTFCPYKVGDVIRVKNNDIEHCITRIKVKTDYLDKNHWGGQSLDFSCETHPIKKDGGISKNGSYIGYKEVELVRHIDIC